MNDLAGGVRNLKVYTKVDEMNIIPTASINFHPYKIFYS